MSDFDHFTRNGAPVYISRRRFLRGAAATGGVAALAGLGPLERAFGQSLLPSPEASGIEHIVVVMMENRSYDHFLGWYDGADGRQGGLRYADASGALHRTHRLAPDYQGCGHPDPDHSYEGGRIEYNNGACDGWLRAGDNDEYAIGYYVKKDLDFYGPAVPYWTTCDRYFSAIMAGTFANRVYQHAAQTDRLRNTFELSMLPTIWDRLAAAGSKVVLFQRSSISCAVGRIGHLDRAALRIISCRRRGGDAASCFLRRTQIPWRRARPVKRRSPACRHSKRPGVSESCVFGGHEQSGMVEDRVRHQLRRVGWIFRSCPADGRADSTRRSGCRQSGWPARVPNAVPRDLTVCPA